MKFIYFFDKKVAHFLILLPFYNHDMDINSFSIAPRRAIRTAFLLSGRSAACEHRPLSKKGAAEPLGIAIPILLSGFSF
jgi:hypothetical protein